MSTPITRRDFTLGGVAAIVGGPTLVSALLARDAAAQSATPSAGPDLSSYGYPTLDITVNTDGFDGIPSETAAGRYLLNVTVASDVDYGSIGFLRPPESSSTDEMLGIIQMFSQMAATPSADASGGEEGGAPPPVFYQATWAGGIGGPGGSALQVVIDLGPGDWIAWGDDPEATQQPVTLTVTGDLPADLTAPDADITVTLVDFGITFDGNLTAGDHVLQVTNEGAEPHFVIVFSAPDGLTDDEWGQLVMYDPNDSSATPPAVPYTQDQFTPLLETAEVSIGVSQWVPWTLEAGTYAAACYFPTAGTGVPHAGMGMHTVFTVE